MSGYIGKLILELVTDSRGKCIETPSGRPQWMLHEPFAFQSDTLKRTIHIPIGFVTDLESCPRLPFVFWLFGDVSNEAAITHDYLYTEGIETRETCDAVLKEACLSEGVSEWKSFGIWAGVRVGGGSHFGSK